MVGTGTMMLAQDFDVPMDGNFRILWFRRIFAYKLVCSQDAQLK
jgi:hypothetical protein